jgi:hypothetical protein
MTRRPSVTRRDATREAFMTYEWSPISTSPFASTASDARQIVT